MMEFDVTTGDLHLLLSVARVARTQERSEALPAIAALVADALGFKTVVINLYRPAWDDFEVVTVHGSEAARLQLLGRTEPRSAWLALLDDAYLERGTHFHRHELHAGRKHPIETHVPDLPPRADPGDWHPDDLLVIAMRDSAGELIGVLSVDGPVSGRRPTDADLDMLVLAAAHVAESLEQCTAADRARRDQSAFQELLRVSTGLSRLSSLDEVLAAVCDAISSALGFEKVVALMADGDGAVHPRAAAGWPDFAQGPSRPFALRDLEPLLADVRLRHGCALLDEPTAQRTAPAALGDGEPSARNGIGPHAWRSHWLLVPLHDPGGELTGALRVDEPVDRLIPSDESLRALRLFADQAASAIEVVRRLAHLQELTERDALTGLANRRALRAFLGGRFVDGLAMLSCDLDFFKAINDRLGHQAGDEILIRFAEVLASAARPSDLAVRLGGEEFVLILPGADDVTALGVAERVRGRTRAAFSDIPGGVSVSIGVATSPPGAEIDLSELIEGADQALYSAKRAGRDRSVLTRVLAPPAVLPHTG